MKKFLKPIVMLICLYFIVQCVSVSAGAAENNVFLNEEVSSAEKITKLCISETAKDYLYENYDVIMDAFLDTVFVSEEYIDAEDYYFSDPFIIYLFMEEQDEIYYIPITNKSTETIVAVVGIMNTIYGYSYNIHSSYIDALNEIDYNHSDIIVYRIGESIVFESENKQVCYSTFSLEEENETEAEQFLEKSFEQKKKLVFEKINQMNVSVPYNINEEGTANLNAIKKLDLYCPMGQCGYGNCWACAVATVANYINLTSVTGFTICIRMGIGYDEGGTIYDMQDALALYGITYSKIRSTPLAWDEILQNIDNDKPAIMLAYPRNSTLGHATTIYGYDTSTKMVYMWNSNLNKGSGDYDYFLYSKRSYDIDGLTYIWSTTLSYY